MATTADAAAETDKMRLPSWWMLAVLLLFYTLSLVDRGAISLLVVPIQQDLGLDDIDMGIILGPAFAISYAVFGLPMGWASDRFPRRWIIFGAIVIWSAAAAGTGLAWSFTTLLIARILVGIGEAPLSPIAYTLIADSFPAKRLTFALSFYQMGSKLGAAASFTVVAGAAVLAAWLAGTHLPLFGELNAWQLTLIITGAPGILLAFLVFSFREPARRTHHRDTTESSDLLPYLRKDWRIMVPMLTGMMLLSMAILAAGSWVPTYLQRQWGLLPQQYGPVLTAINLIAAGTLVFKGMIVDWLHARGVVDAHLRFLGWILVICTPLSLLAFLTSSLTLFWISYAVIDILAGQFVLYIGATVQLVAPSFVRGRIMAMVQACFTLVGMGLGPLVTAIITERVFADPMRLGDSLAIVVPCAFALAVVAIWLALPQVRRAAEQEREAK